MTFLRKILPALALCMMVASCKIGQSSVQQTTKIPRNRKETTLAPDECLVNARVLFEAGPDTFGLRIYEVKEVGFGFSQNINAGDKIRVISALAMEKDDTIDVILEWIDSIDGGYYQVKTGAE
jgi:hypothetical protein